MKYEIDLELNRKIDTIDEEIPKKLKLWNEWCEMGKKIIVALDILAGLLMLFTPTAWGQDTDGDGVEDAVDNSPSMPNGSLLGTCVKTKAGVFVSYRVGDPGEFFTCTSGGL